MIRIDHVHIVQVCGCRLISQVHRMRQRQIPDWESLVFRITSTNSAFMFVVELGQTGRHLSASRSRCCYNNQRLGCLNIFIMAISILAHDQRNIVRIPWDQVMTIYFHAHLFQTVLEHLCAVLSCIMRNADTSHVQILRLKDALQTQQIRIISDTQISTNFIFLNIFCADHNNDLHLICKLHQHTKFTIRLKSRQYAGCMIIIIKLAAKLQIQFIVKLLNPFPNMF